MAMSKESILAFLKGLNLQTASIVLVFAAITGLFIFFNPFSSKTQIDKEVQNALGQNGGQTDENQNYSYIPFAGTSTRDSLEDTKNQNTSENQQFVFDPNDFTNLRGEWPGQNYSSYQNTNSPQNSNGQNSAPQNGALTFTSYVYKYYESTNPETENQWSAGEAAANSGVSQNIVQNFEQSAQAIVEQAKKEGSPNLTKAQIVEKYSIQNPPAENTPLDFYGYINKYYNKINPATGQKWQSQEIASIEKTSLITIQQYDTTAETVILKSPEKNLTEDQIVQKYYAQDFEEAQSQTQPVSDYYTPVNNGSLTFEEYVRKYYSQTNPKTKKAWTLEEIARDADVPLVSVNFYSDQTDYIKQYALQLNLPARTPDQIIAIYSSYSSSAQSPTSTAGSTYTYGGSTQSSAVIITFTDYVTQYYNKINPATSQIWTVQEIVLASQSSETLITYYADWINTHGGGSQLSDSQLIELWNQISDDEDTATSTDTTLADLEAMQCNEGDPADSSGCLAQTAYTEMDPNICLTISNPKFQGTCISMINSITGQNYCYLLKNERAHATCVKDLAQKYKDRSLCAQIPYEGYRTECEVITDVYMGADHKTCDRINADWLHPDIMKKRECLYNYAIWNDNVDYCRLVFWTDYWKPCLKYFINKTQSNTSN